MRPAPIELELPLPPSANATWKAWRHRVVLSAASRRYRRQVSGVVQLAGSPSFGSSPIAVSAEVVPGRRSRDVDNSLKPLLDALTHAGVWVDDAQVRELHVWRMSPANDEGCVRVFVAEVAA